MVKKLYLFRHGQTDYNVYRYFYGSQDVSINKVGESQAKRLHERVKHSIIDCVYTSGLRRTKETAKLIFPEYPLIEKIELNEKDFGLWEAMDANGIQEKFPVEWEKWLNDPFGYTPPMAEAFGAFKNRVEKSIDDILLECRNQNAVAIVAHLGVLRIIYQYLVDSKAVFWDIDFPQDEISTFVFNGFKWERTTLN